MTKGSQVQLIGRKIRQLRRQRKLTQTELADRIGIHQSDLSRMEKGEYKVGLDTLLRILGTFDIAIGEFFEEGARDHAVINKYRRLSPNAQKEVETFIEFKRLQEQGFDHDSEGGSEGGQDE